MPLGRGLYIYGVVKVAGDVLCVYLSAIIYRAFVFAARAIIWEFIIVARCISRCFDFYSYYVHKRSRVKTFVCVYIISGTDSALVGG